MAKNKRVVFNIKNVKYAIKSEMNVYGTVKDLSYANSLTLEPDYSEQKLYGDGLLIGILSNDKGKTGTLGVVDINNDYEVDCGRLMEIEDGLADVQQLRTVEHAIYYEVDSFLNNETLTIKCWLFGCVTGKPTESYNQTTEDVTINPFEYPLTVMGDVLLDNAGTEPYEDTNGNQYKVFRKVSYPDDNDYDGFEDEVPSPKALGE